MECASIAVKREGGVYAVDMHTRTAVCGRRQNGAGGNGIAVDGVEVGICMYGSFFNSVSEWHNVVCERECAADTRFVAFDGGEGGEECY